MPLIEVKNLTLGYGPHVVAEKISFTVNNGDYLCILGENGSGKSTLMKTLLGLNEVLDGTFEFGDGLKKNQIGYLPQQNEMQKDFPASVKEIVMSGFQNRFTFRPYYKKEEKLEAKKIMEDLQITPLAKRCYRELSGGQQQRVLLARAMCAAKKILLLDEPVSGLDPKVTQNMYEIIDRINKNGSAIIMISHDINAALKYATHILHIGKEIFFGTRDEYLKSVTGKIFLKKSGALDD